MQWLFLLGIIYLAIAHEGFRKVVLWATGAVAAFYISLAVYVLT